MNEILEMGVLHLAELGTLKYVHHTMDTYSGFQWSPALCGDILLLFY